MSISFICELPCSAFSFVVLARLVASLAFEALFFVWDAISEIEAVSCSTELACSVAP